MIELKLEILEDKVYNLRKLADEESIFSESKLVSQIDNIVEKVYSRIGLGES